MGNHEDSDPQPLTGLDELDARLAAGEASIEALQGRADVALDLARVSEGSAEEDRSRIETLEARGAVDRAMIAQLSAEGVIDRKHAVELEQALRSSPMIGAAIGIVMVTCRVGEAEAFEVLKKASKDSNRKVRVLAEEIGYTGEVGRLRAV